MARFGTGKSGKLTIESYWIPVELLRNPRLLRGAASSMACWCFGRHAEAVEFESKHSRTEISHKIKVKGRLMARALRNWNSLNFQTSKTARETEPETIELWKSWTEASTPYRASKQDEANCPNYTSAGWMQSLSWNCTGTPCAKRLSTCDACVSRSLSNNAVSCPEQCP